MLQMSCFCNISSSGTGTLCKENQRSSGKKIGGRGEDDSTCMVPDSVGSVSK